ncbi:YjiH family protein [Oceanobacillus neutriphilus]|uniref:Membrane protein n=1 Tax=Oceanobacillus neutriphilus TaxID=531815 RepID=A0ABQ2P0X2_9BACI|nr:YjiH family protein [Oceanobacillus neutriphilus]GGP15338.1 membrane protein [Oceanobacillus neutriphilus]
MKSYSFSNIIKFIIPSLLGLFLFLYPLPTKDGFTIPIAFLAGILEGAIDNYLSLIMMIVILLTAIFTISAKFGGKSSFKRFPFLHQLFYTTWFWTITRFLAAVFAVMVYFQIGPEFVYNEDTGGMLLDSLLHTLFVTFLFAGLFLPFLTNFGLLEFFGGIMRNIMRPLFRLPGRASVDSLASWVGDATIGVLLTNKQYEEGYYTKREAAIISTTFSVVSITFTLVILQQVGLEHMFLPFYLTILIAGGIAAFIMPRIPPLSGMANTYIDGKERTDDEKIPESENAVTFGFKNALRRAEKETSFRTFFVDGGKNILDMWFGVTPVVMAFGTIAVIIAEYTPLFQWLGMPFVPILELMQIPFAHEASETLLIGFADMFLPAILITGVEAEITRFIIAALSVTQLIFMSEVGGLILGTKIPVSFRHLAIIFLIRTAITLPIITVIAHILF